ncbi:MAG TPA: rod shape-determining protein MreC [Terriglobia bacterium]|nr:rod shape-determining protein MreC [Terriglobia bacterium]
MSRTVVESKKPVWIVLTVALVIHTGLISLQGRRRIDTSFVRMWILDSLAPMEKLVDRSTHGLWSVWNGYIALIGLHGENDRLKRENDALRMQIANEHESVLEAQRVLALNGLPAAGMGRTLVARVIGRDAGRSQTVTIDKGLAHGVKPDSAVITAAGVVGRVIQSSNFFSIVQLITDSQSAVAVLLESNREQGIIKGNGGAILDLDYIDDDNALKEGDKFLTSGMDKVYPKGLPLGTITSIGARRGLIKTVEIRPAADLGRLEEVLLVVDRPQSSEVADPTFQGPVLP